MPSLSPADHRPAAARARAHATSAAAASSRQQEVRGAAAAGDVTHRHDEATPPGGTAGLQSRRARRSQAEVRACVAERTTSVIRAS